MEEASGTAEFGIDPIPSRYSECNADTDADTLVFGVMIILCHFTLIFFGNSSVYFALSPCRDRWSCESSAAGATESCDGRAKCGIQDVHGAEMFIL